MKELAPHFFGNLRYFRLLGEVKKTRFLRRAITRLGLGLLKNAASGTAATALGCIDALRVTAIDLSAGLTGPLVLEVDLIAVLGRDFDAVFSIHGMIFHHVGALDTPGLETGSVGSIGVPGDDVVCDVAVFVCQGVDETVHVGNDVRCQDNGHAPVAFLRNLVPVVVISNAALG